MTDSLATLKARKLAIEKRKLAIESKIRKIESRKNGETRRKENRLKFLTGAAVLSQAGKNPDFKITLYDLLARALTRKEDRALFGLPPLPVATDKK